MIGADNGPVWFDSLGGQDGQGRRISPEFVSLNTRAELVVENFGVVDGFYGAEMQALFADFEKAAGELG